MNPTKTLEGIIYRIYNSGPADKVIYLIDNLGQKNTMLAKGAKKQNSKKGPAMELGNHITAKVIEGYNIPLITDVKLNHEFLGWKQDYQKMIFLQFFCEVIDKFTFEQNVDARLFKILYNVLSSNTDRIIYLAGIFLINILDITGHLPELNECVVTSDAIKPEGIYSIRDYVGYVSDSVAKKPGIYAEKITDRIVKTQKFIIDHSIHDALKVSLTKEEEKQLFNIEINWIETVLEKELKSKSILLSTLK